jgi:tripartite-type tricarboxylate transporter receptor subunit TctC
MNRRVCALAFAAAIYGTVMAPASHEATAQGFPSKPIRLVIPVGPGGGQDFTGRVIAQKLTDLMGQSVVAENRSGAGSVVGTDYAAKAPPDGYTIVICGISSMSINPSLYPNLPYDPMRDLTPIAMLVDIPFVLVVHPGLPARTVSELIALAKASPGKLNYASSGTGTLLHLAGEMFKSMAALDVVHVPFRSVGATYPELQSGQVQYMFDNITTSIGQIRGGNIRPLAVTTGTRAASLPEIPTMVQSGMPGFEFGSWFGLFAPAATPRDAVAKLRAETRRALAAPDVRERFESQSAVIFDMTPEQEAEFLKSELERWTRIVKTSGAKAE